MRRRSSVALERRCAYIEECLEDEARKPFNALLKGASLRDGATSRSGEAILRRTSAAGEGRVEMTTIIESGKNASEVKKNVEAVNRP